MSHIFISYSKKNKVYARKLADHLIASGFDVWIDDRIDYGSEWEEAIQQAIEECAAFLIVMTPESRASKWVKRECQYAESRGKPQFPMLLSGDVFFRYGTTQYADVTDGSLPPDTFLDELAEHASRKRGIGENITAEVTDQQFDDVLVEAEPEETAFPESIGARHEQIGDLPLSGQSSSPSPVSEMDGTSPNSKVVRGAEKRGLRRRTPLVVGMLASIAILILILLASQSGQLNPPTTLATVSPTPDCDFEWFFSDPLPGVCPIAPPIEYDTLIQWFGDGAAFWRKPLLSDFETVYLLGGDGTYRVWNPDWDEITENSTVREQGCSFATHELFVRVREEVRLDFDYLGCPTSDAEREINYYQRSTNDDDYFGTSEGFVIRYHADDAEFRYTWERLG